MILLSKWKDKALELVWLIGDSFMANSYEKISRIDNSQHRLYIKENYDIYAFFNNNHYDTNILSRVRKVLVLALNQQMYLPRFMAIVLDNDLMRFINHSKFGIGLETGTLVEWLVSAFDKAINTRLDQLQPKCKKQGFPHIIWFGVPMHELFQDNDVCEKFNESLESTIPLYGNMSLLLPKKGWNACDRGIIKKDSFTLDGMKMYWYAIDAALHFWDTRKQNQTIQKSTPFGHQGALTTTKRIIKTSMTLKSTNHKFAEYSMTGILFQDSSNSQKGLSNMISMAGAVSAREIGIHFTGLILVNATTTGSSPNFRLQLKIINVNVTAKSINLDYVIHLQAV